MNSNDRLNWNSTCRLHTEYRAMVGREGVVHQMPVLIPECLLPSQWVPVLAPTYLLTRRSEWVFTLHQSTSRNALHWSFSYFLHKTCIRSSDTTQFLALYTHTHTEGQTVLQPFQGANKMLLSATFPISPLLFCFSSPSLSVHHIGLLYNF